MFDTHEAFKLLNEATKEEDRPTIIHIDVYVENELEEALPSGNIEDKYDEQTLEDWYDFASTVEGIIDNFGNVVNISLSKQPNSLSEYIDFYVVDKDGNQKKYLIDLRLSDHKSTPSARQNRKRHVKKIDSNYVLKSVLVNNKQFASYDAAIIHIREILAKEFMG